MNQIEAIYPKAIMTEQPLSDDTKLHYYDKSHNRYIAIPKEDITEKEAQLLAHFYVLMEQEKQTNQYAPLAQAWWDFLFGEGECPEAKTERVRFLYVQLSANDQSGFLEAVDTFFDYKLLVVWIGEKECLLIEEESDYPVQEEDVRIFLDVLAGDFYITGRLFLGRFSTVQLSLKAMYHNELEAARKAVLFMPEQRVMRIEMLIPQLLVVQSGGELSRLFANELALFQEDYDLRNMLQLLIQNHLNVSQTAKQLHLHRNSLQYRLDKFIHRTGIDIRSYEGAFVVYMLCLLSGKR
ncbi:PucR family transcriptional regulator [Lysinibacillus piscis]|uniref:PucR C-terminal helix-turn-helix domain-containing protein n=1 Tax=Lysinibacillus piscis TaxID=2518931 RepID=A0ABQ5NKR2_9BACI|nr:helix-turn-helix domain-containing protein [Lysinibacillus sp. KH24]GLC88948.1 hypothetical protein LYSBPC_20750 [Lysinibacillus sp. KH24]